MNHSRGSYPGLLSDTVVLVCLLPGPWGQPLSQDSALSTWEWEGHSLRLLCIDGWGRRLQELLAESHEIHTPGAHPSKGPEQRQVQGNRE